MVVHICHRRQLMRRHRSRKRCRRKSIQGSTILSSWLRPAQEHLGEDQALEDEDKDTGMDMAMARTRVEEDGVEAADGDASDQVAV